MRYKVIFLAFFWIFFACKKEGENTSGCNDPRNLHFLSVYDKQGYELTGWVKVYKNISEEVLTDTINENYLEEVLMIDLDPNHRPVNEIKLKANEYLFQLYDAFSKKKKSNVYTVKKCKPISLYW